VERNSTGVVSAVHTTIPLLDILSSPEGRRDSHPHEWGFLVRRDEPSLVTIQVWSYRLSPGVAFPIAHR
jgi:hypothetical protein